MRLANLIAVCGSLIAGSAPAATFTTLYSFPGGPYRGGALVGLVPGQDGSFYGALADAGADSIGLVYKLSPPLGGTTQWTETVLHTFHGSDGSIPWSLRFGPDGALYGETQEGGETSFFDSVGGGVVFKLAPPVQSGGAWTEKTILNFGSHPQQDPPPKGAQPVGGLAQGPQGSFFGVTTYGGEPCYAGDTFGCGIVFRLILLENCRTGGFEKVVYRFSGADGAGPVSITGRGDELYGLTFSGGDYGHGVAFKLSRPAPGQTAWTEATLHSFRGGTADGAQPYGGPLAIDRTGALYGTTRFGGGRGCNGYGCGTVFQLAPPSAGNGAWTETVIHAFNADTDGSTPYVGVVFGSDGAMYGVTISGGTSGLGTVYKMVPPPVGQTSWMFTVLHTFSGPDGEGPAAALYLDQTGTLYGTTTRGGQYGAGTVFQIVQ